MCEQSSTSPLLVYLQCEEYNLVTHTRPKEATSFVPDGQIITSFFRLSKFTQNSTFSLNKEVGPCHHEIFQSKQSHEYSNEAIKR